jgi:hypothetical protein
MSDSTQLKYPIVMTQAGATPQAPAELLLQLVNLVTFGTDPDGKKVMTPSPGYTAGLPGSLIEDISSTDTAALVLCDRARVELINSLTPFGANAFIVNQLGQLFGIESGITTNVTVGVVFTGTVNFTISRGFVVSDGGIEFVIQDGGIIGALGVSTVLTAISTRAGSFPVPAGTVTQVVTSISDTVNLSVTNPSDGFGGTTTETEQAYRVRVLQASTVACQGSATFLKTLLLNVHGVVPNQVGVQGVVGAGWKVICGGANPDPYQIANAIYQALPDIALLQASVMTVAGVTNATLGLVTTGLNHGYLDNQVVTFSGVQGMTQLNSGQYTVKVVTPTTFTIGVNTTAFGVYTGGGVLSPNLRNNLIMITDFPDVYQIPFVTPPSQTVSVVLTWNAVSILASGAVISQLAATEIITYINALPVGNPINLFAMEEAVQDAIEPLVPLSTLSRIVWSIAINNVPMPPAAGTGLIYGDLESYFVTDPSKVVVVQG